MYSMLAPDEVVVSPGGRAVQDWPGQNCTVPDPLQLPSPCVVVLVGPGASGKSTWAAAHFPPAVIVSSDRLRALVGSGEDDIGASEDAFTLLGTVIERRLGRGLTTVIDTLGLDDDRRLGWLEAAKRHRMPCVVVTFDTSAEECRARNRGRPHQIPANVLSAQLKSWRRVRERLPAEGFDAVVAAAPLRVVPAPSSMPRNSHAGRPRSRPVSVLGSTSGRSVSMAERQPPVTPFVR